MILDYLNKNEMIDENCILTKKGRIVSEINECNPLIMSKIIDSNMLDDLEFPEIMGILSLFIADKDREELFVNDLNISNKEMAIIKTIFNFSTDLSNDEIKLIQKVPFPFSSEWNLSLNMIEIIKDWANGEEWLAISHKFNNFIGNFIKNVLRLANVTRNIEAIAILLNNVSLINKLNGFQEKLIRDIVITDSLYC
jgi:antiviral helicase SKI2